MENKKYKGKILIVDDEEGIRDILEDFLSQKNFEVRTAKGGNEALEKLNLFKPDIMLMDMKMPDMGGKEILKYIQEQKIDVEIIIITAYTDFISDSKILNMAYDYIIKPINLDYLTKTILAKVTLLCDQ